MLKLSGEFLAWIGRRPRAAFWAFAAVHVAIWTLIPVLAEPNWPLDVIEQIAWGKEWQLVFFKHPPLPAWVIELGVQATGNAYWAPFLISQIWVATAFWAVWRLSRMIVDEVRALLAVVMLEGVTYYNLHATEFNHNVAQLPFWALIGWLLYRAILRDRPLDWMLAGLFAGLAVLAKYSSGILLLPLAVFVLLEPRARARLGGAGPWLAVAIALAVVAPNLYALVRIDFLPFTYSLERAARATSAIQYFADPALFAGGQVLNGLGALALAACLAWGTAPKVPESRAAPADGEADLQADRFARRYVLVLALGPLLFACLLSAALGLELPSPWGQPMLGFAGLAMLLRIPHRVSPAAMARFATLWATIFGGMVATEIAHYRIAPYFDFYPTRSNYPGRAIAAEIGRQWSAATGGRRLRYVAGHMWAAGNVADNLDPRPSVFWDNAARSPYVDLAALRRDGAVIVWQTDRWVESESQQLLLEMFPDARRQPAIVRPYLISAAIPPAVVEWAIVPPAGVTLFGPPGPD